jgi:hypothetical protein
LANLFISRSLIKDKHNNSVFQIIIFINQKYFSHPNLHKQKRQKQLTLLCPFLICNKPNTTQKKQCWLSLLFTTSVQFVLPSLQLIPFTCGSKCCLCWPSLRIVHLETASSSSQDFAQTLG